MVRRRQRERSLFEVLLPDGHKLWPDWLRRIDTVLEDEAVIEVVAQALEARWPQSRRRGRPGTPAEVVIRMLILKHLFDWSYDDLEQEVRANLVYRAFTRIDAGEVPDAKTILKIAGALGPDVIAQLHRQVVEVAKRAGVTRGRRFRIDTTVVETNVHYPTDSTLLQDGVRVLTRTMQRASTALGDQPGRIRNRLRSVTRGVLTIGYQARSPKTRDALVHSYRKLVATTRAVLRDADTMVRRLGQRRRTATAVTASVLQRAQQQLQQMRPLVDRVVAQTRARVLGGDTHVAGQSPQCLRTAHHDDSEGQDREAERVREPGDHSRSGTSDHHRLRGPCGAPGRRHAVDAGPGPTPGDLRARAVSRGRRSGLQLGGQRTGRRRSRGTTRDLAAARAEVGRAAHARTPRVVPPRSTLARRMRRAHQRH